MVILDICWSMIYLWAHVYVMFFWWGNNNNQSVVFIFVSKLLWTDYDVNSAMPIMCGSFSFISIYFSNFHSTNTIFHFFCVSMCLVRMYFFMISEKSGTFINITIISTVKVLIIIRSFKKTPLLCPTWRILPLTTP